MQLMSLSYGIALLKLSNKMQKIVYFRIELRTLKNSADFNIKSIRQKLLLFTYNLYTTIKTGSYEGYRDFCVKPSGGY